MGKPNLSENFKRDAVAQITGQSSIAEVAQRLGISQNSLRAWQGRSGQTSLGDEHNQAEIQRLQRKLARVTKERDILVQAIAKFAKGMM